MWNQYSRAPRKALPSYCLAYVRDQHGIMSNMTTELGIKLLPCSKTCNKNPRQSTCNDCIFLMQQPGHLKKGKNFMYSTKLTSWQENLMMTRVAINSGIWILYFDIALLDHIFYCIISADTTTLFTCYKILHAHIPCNSIYVWIDRYKCHWSPHSQNCPR